LGFAVAGDFGAVGGFAAVVGSPVVVGLRAAVEFAGRGWFAGEIPTSRAQDAREMGHPADDNFPQDDI